jgi:hypothetical protein
MSFWNLSDTTEKLPQGGEFNAGGGDIEPIPADTQVKAAPDEAKWDTNQEGDSYISLRWSVLAPEQYKNRKVFQKLWVLSNDPNAKDPAKKGDKAKRMLAAIAHNAGGGLLKVEGKPTDQDLQKNLLMKPMALTLQVWEMGDGKGNWVQQVSPLATKKKEAPAPAAVDEDDIGF